MKAPEHATTEVAVKNREGRANKGAKPGERRGGRRKGTPNAITKALKDMILQAAEAAHPEGTVGYLTLQAQTNAPAFLTLLGKVLPKEITGADGTPLVPSSIHISFESPADNG